MTNKKIAVLVLFIMLGLPLALGRPLYAQTVEGEEHSYESKGKRDPFIPLITSKTKIATGLEDVQTIDDIVLEGIFWDPRGGSIAVINGVLLKEGQQVGSVKIKSIEKVQITLYINEVEYVKNLVEEKGDKNVVTE